MKSTKLANILAPLRAANDYGVAASLNGDPQERATLEGLMMDRLERALENAGFEIVSRRRKAA